MSKQVNRNRYRLKCILKSPQIGYDRANLNQERLLENVEYDEFGAQKFKKGVPHYQSGFPPEHRVCHR